ncbi:MAG: DUF3443 family protein [Gammaproteobacteria bacterium]|nr:DUF3443 family protein [Gammaproteobacteria bacterium]
MRNFVSLALLALMLAACGGGGGGGYGGGGGGGGGGGPPPVTNIEPITVKIGPNGNVNTAFLSVKVCVPGSTTQCQTIDNVEVDTQSTGLRLLGSVLTIPLPIQTHNSTPLAECLQFADGSSFGPVATADVTLPTSGKSVSGLRVQIIGDAGYQTVPGDCPAPPENTVQAFGANGILGVGPFLQDCGPACETVASPNNTGFYYVCASASSCTNTTVTLAEQVPHPASAFATDNNGVIVQLPTAPSTGATSLTGSLIFGIGTQSDNALGNAKVLLADPNTAFIHASYNGTNYPQAYIDSGSNGNYFTDNSITVCAANSSAPGFYCPPAPINITATLTGTNNVMQAADFTVDNASSDVGSNPTFAVFPNLAGPNPQATSFDLGLPFFYGRTIFTAIEQQSTPAGTGPYYAY